MPAPAALARLTALHDARTRHTPLRPPFPPDPQPDQCSGPRAARDRPSNDRPSRSGVRANREDGAGGAETRIPDGAGRRHLSRQRHRRLGGRAGEHTFTRRPRADGRDRPFRHALAEARRQARPGGRVPARRLAPRRRPGRDREAPARRRRPDDQGRLRRSQRDINRGDDAYRADPCGDRPHRPSRPAAGRYDLVARLDRLPPR